LIISLKEGVLFEPGTASLSPKAQKTLDHLAKVLKKMSRPIRVEGHTDNTPIATKQYPSNWELSTSRATHIIKYFITQHHFPANKLSAAGYGEFKPITNNSTIEGKQKNRRVDIVVLNPQSTQEEPQQDFNQPENFKNSAVEETNHTPMVSNDVSPSEPHEITQEKMIHHGTTH
ncbi:MAG: OmpA family protein, partial [Cyanobacteria bacterium]|nr:OmpA family protein [Cyanobacteriota bacterium]